MAKAPSKKISQVKGGGRWAKGKVHIDIDETTHDLGPWIQVPDSTRISQFRYDFANRAVQVCWKGRGLDRAYVYNDVPYEVYRSMVRAKSKGKFINAMLNNYDYAPGDPDEIGAPSNEQRSQPMSRAR